MGKGRTGGGGGGGGRGGLISSYAVACWRRQAESMTVVVWKGGEIEEWLLTMTSVSRREVESPSLIL